MPKGIYTRNKEWRENLSRRNKEMGLKPSFLGRKHSEETKQKLREDNLKNPRRYWLGKKFSKEYRKKLSEAHKGYKMPEEQKRKIGKKSRERKGEKCGSWKGGITPEYRRIRHSIEFRLWREAVFARDNWTCQKTGIKGGKLHPHHILNFAQYPELRFAIDNGITLSDETHREFHKIYGRANNTKEQLEKFLDKKIMAQ